MDGWMTKSTWWCCEEPCPLFENTAGLHQSTHHSLMFFRRQESWRIFFFFWNETPRKAFPVMLHLQFRHIIHGAMECHLIIECPLLCYKWKTVSGIIVGSKRKFCCWLSLGWKEVLLSEKNKFSKVLPLISQEKMVPVPYGLQNIVFWAGCVIFIYLTKISCAACLFSTNSTAPESHPVNPQQSNIFYSHFAGRP